LAQKLCQQAADEFTNCGGEALFLGTANPIAARVYGRVGWQHLPNSDVMLRITGTQGTHEYISGYFNGGANLSVEVVEGGARQRIGMIPLIVQPHEWITLDANVGLFSTQVSKQMSCMGLYPKYKDFEKSGEWFAAERSDGATVGLASIRLIDPDTSQVDAFTQVPQHFKTTETLYRLALKCLTATNSNRVRAVCDDDDELKRSILTRIGFRATKQTIRVETGQSLITLREYHLSLSKIPSGI
jgi:hypothetical protein